MKFVRKNFTDKPKKEKCVGDNYAIPTEYIWKLIEEANKNE